MPRISLTVARAALVFTPALAFAQGGASPQVTVPMRSVAAPNATSTETVGLARGLRLLANGRVLVNDAGRRRVLLFDGTLSSAAVVIDSTPGLANSYGRFPVPLINYLGDSTIFLDYNSQSLLVFDEKGKVARVTAVPKPSDASYLMSGGGTPGVDRMGRLIYRSYIRAPIPTSMGANGFNQPQAPPDSAPIVRADWDTGQVDTVVKFKISSGSPMTSKLAPDGTRSYTTTVNPLQWTDDWVVTSEGNIAVVRGQDYHIDWVMGDGKHVSSPKMPYDWRRLTDEDKQAIVDSVRHVNDSIAATPQGGIRMMTQGLNGAPTTTVIPINYQYVPLSQMPDYYPPIRTGGVFADLDGNVWILPYTSAQGQSKGLVYDVVNSSGVLFERVQFPEGRSLAGFGKGGVIYMMNPAPLAKPTDRPGTAGFFLERTVIAGERQ